MWAAFGSGVLMFLRGYKDLIVVFAGMTILAGIAAPLVLGLTSGAISWDACLQGNVLGSIVAIAGFIAIPVTAAVGVRND